MVQTEKRQGCTNSQMIKLKKLLKEWNDTSFKDLPKRWTKPYMKEYFPKDGLTEFERLGGKDLDEAPMSDTKKGFLMLKIWGQSWSVNMGKVFKGVNREKPAMIRKGLKELKILHKKIEEQIEELI